MSNMYQYVDETGNIINVEYNRNLKLSNDQVMDKIENAFRLFNHSVNIERLEDYKEIYKVDYSNLDTTDTVLVCAKGTTPGGRSNLKDEQRIQQKAKYINYAYNQMNQGQKVVLLGVYNYNEMTIFCAWRLEPSTANSDDVPISKQIKISCISEAFRNGFAQQKKGKSEYVCAFRSEFIYFYLQNIAWIHQNEARDLPELGNALSVDDEMTNNEDSCIDEYNSEDLVKFETSLNWDGFKLNWIIFGAPGTGKSWTLNNKKDALLLENFNGFERVTFHPDYTYSQFVGAYKPTTNPQGDICYEFVPGPFMRVYVNALKSGRTDNPKPWILIIEEINRARVAGVFCDIFQLLDRNEKGVSEYEIQASEDVKKYLAKELGGNPSNYSKLRIPNNMFLWATMNSADQGVYPMDTAFKRRWEFEYISVDENQESIQCTVNLIKDNPASKINWNKLRKAINNKLLDNCRVNEDKLMGPFFLSRLVIQTNEDGQIIDEEAFRQAFKSKIIMYLFEDAARQYREKLFKKDVCKMYSSLCKEFDKNGMSIFGDDFKSTYYDQQRD